MEMGNFTPVSVKLAFYRLKTRRFGFFVAFSAVNGFLGVSTSAAKGLVAQ